MVSIIFYAALALVSADLSGDLGAVSSNAVDLASAVSSWSSDDGLSGALVIQQSYDPLSKAVDDLSGSVSGVSSSDIENNVEGIQGLATSVVSLLEALTEKADDFESVGASDIVKGDINGLSGPSASIVSDLVDAAGDAIPSDLADAANDLSSAFEAAISAYGADSADFPSVAAGGDSGSEAASSGAAESSGADSEDAEPTNAPASGAGNSTGGTSVAEETVVETVCTHETCTGISPANGAVRNVVIGGSVAAVFAALL